MISEVCPIDRLMQRAGRLCRFDNSVGEMYILIPYKDNTLYPTPYGSYSQSDKSWIPCKALLATMDILKRGIYIIRKTKCSTIAKRNVYKINFCLQNQAILKIIAKYTSFVKKIDNFFILGKLLISNNH